MFIMQEKYGKSEVLLRIFIENLKFNFRFLHYKPLLYLPYKHTRIEVAIHPHSLS